MLWTSLLKFQKRRHQRRSGLVRILGHSQCEVVIFGKIWSAAVSSSLLSKQNLGLVFDKNGDGWFMDSSTVRDMCSPLSFSKSCQTAEMQSKAEGAGRWVWSTLAEWPVDYEKVVILGERAGMPPT